MAGRGTRIDSIAPLGKRRACRSPLGVLYASPRPGGSSAAAAATWVDWWLREPSLALTITLGALTASSAYTVTTELVTTVTLDALTLVSAFREPVDPTVSPVLMWWGPDHRGLVQGREHDGYVLAPDHVGTLIAPLVQEG